ncbi:MAG: DUF4861 family protein [Candidatus Latescibacteria bacterium]|nr:DUF4861 family protein [Candidatus Latescibacterota bacterium]
MTFRNTVFVLAIFLAAAGTAVGQDDGWYTEGNYVPMKRIKVTIRNTLTIERKDCPVVIRRCQLPYQNIPQRYITVVDPSLPGTPEPSQEMLKKASGYLIRKEDYGHYLEYQMDDLDKDGLWDEIFFLTDLAPREGKTIYLYIGKAERGLYRHKTHAGIGYYGRHIVPFWEAEFVGWKLWFPTSVDLHGKREPMLTAYAEYKDNLSGYYMPYEYGTDIMTVASTFGDGGIGLSEIPADPDSVSRPQYDYNTGIGPFQAERYAYDVVANGPLRSMIRVKTMNWNTGSGSYELKQLYTAVAHKSWSTCEVRFTRFMPPGSETMFVCGMREIMEQYKSYNKGGVAISFGKDLEIRSPNEDIGDEAKKVAFEGIAMAVRDEYNPEYRNIKRLGGNHIFRIPVTPDCKFEYMIFGAWSQGKVLTTPGEFKKYVITEARKYNNPLKISVGAVENKK